MKILITVKEKYGNELLYPLCDTAKKVCELADVRVITLETDLLQTIGDSALVNPLQTVTLSTATVGEPTITATTQGTMPGGFVIALVQAGSPTLPQKYNLTFPAASTLAPGDYWLTSKYVASETAAQYYVWYRINGVGVDPAIGGRTGIRVDIYSLDSALITANKSANSVIDTAFYLPDLRNLFIRGWDISNQPGVKESGQVGLHNHKMNVYDSPPVPPLPNSRPSGRYLSETIVSGPPSPPLVEPYNNTHNGNTLADDAIDMGSTGTGTENRSPNKRVVYIIKHD